MCKTIYTSVYSAAAKSFITVHNRTMFHWLCIEILGVLSFLTSWMYTITSTFFQHTPKYNYFWFLFVNSITTCIVVHFHLGLLFFTDTLTVLYIHVYLSVVIVLKKMICSSLTLCGTTMLVLFCVQHNVLQNFNTVNSACITLWHSCIFFHRLKADRAQDTKDSGNQVTTGILYMYIQYISITAYHKLSLVRYLVLKVAL